MRDDPHRDRALLFHSRRRYQRREGERREARVAAAAARLRAIKRYGDVAAPMRESHHRVREELERTMQGETGFISNRSR
ncbi:unnamed protein product [Phytomonas sp. EM1]|nr:unnamed protein product [Phytomonas sp. EM1]|eukprot:CCW60601.1 unnamed protein product [Phytomonas sp. isolate EM1]